jgi:hypothetical protein
MPDAADIYVYGLLGNNHYFLASHDSGASWTAPTPTWSGGIIALRFYANGNGLALVGSRGSDLSSYIIRDSGRRFDDINDSLLGAKYLIDAVILDTFDIWATDIRGYMLHSTDKGISWIGHSAISEIERHYWLSFITPSSNPKQVYAIFNFHGLDTGIVPIFSPDYVETTDGGETWKIDSSVSGSRIYRLCSLPGNHLWALVGRKPSSWNHGDIVALASYNCFADSVFYSPDDGATWYKDGITFQGDTLAEMRWPDKWHGYITAWRDTSLIIYRFISEERVAKPSPLPETPSLRIIAPVSEILSFEASVAGPVRITLFDLLGRERLQSTWQLTDGIPNSLSVHDLEPGYYRLALQSGTITVSQGFVKQ